MSLICPECKSDDLDVRDSRPAVFGDIGTVKRRRVCARCGHKFFTYEIPAPIVDDAINNATADVKRKLLHFLADLT